MWGAFDVPLVAPPAATADALELAPLVFDALDAALLLLDETLSVVTLPVSPASVVPLAALLLAATSVLMLLTPALAPFAAALVLPPPPPHAANTKDKTNAGTMRRPTEPHCVSCVISASNPKSLLLPQALLSVLLSAFQTPLQKCHVVCVWYEVKAKIGAEIRPIFVHRTGR
jgi:hypothetical protein